jgi:hypothetical protein
MCTYKPLEAFTFFAGEQQKLVPDDCSQHCVYLNRRAAEKSLIPYEEEKHANIGSIHDPDHELPIEAQRKNLQRARETLEQLPLQFREVIIL